MSSILLLPDAGPLITLAYAQALDLLFKPGWPVQIVDMVFHEVTRNQTPTNHAIDVWVKANNLDILPTKTFAHSRDSMISAGSIAKKSNLGEFAIQEVMNNFVFITPQPTGVFLFEDHKIARSSFLLPAPCQKVSTRAFLIFLEQNKWIESAADIERRAILNGRHFSQLHFPLQT